jgi:hypothetical protein
MAKSSINLGAKLMSLCKSKFHFDHLPYSLWYDLEFAVCVGQVWQSGILTGSQEKRKSIGKGKLVQSVRSLVGEVDSVPYKALALAEAVEQKTQEMINLVCSDPALTFEERNSREKHVRADVAAIKKKFPPGYFSFSECSQVPWLIECLNAQTQINPYFTHQDEVQELSLAMREMGNFIRKTNFAK